MKPVFATASATIYGYRDSWSLAGRPGSPQNGKDCIVELEIRSDGGDGFILVMAPHGFFTADSGHGTLQSAMDTAKELFDVDPTEWSYSN